MEATEYAQNDLQNVPVIVPPHPLAQLPDKDRTLIPNKLPKQPITVELLPGDQ